MSSPQWRMRGRTAYHVTMSWAVCAGSYCRGCKLRMKSAALKRAAGKIRSSSAPAMAYFGILISTLYSKVHALRKNLKLPIPQGQGKTANVIREPETVSTSALALVKREWRVGRG